MKTISQNYIIGIAFIFSLLTACKNTTERDKRQERSLENNEEKVIENNDTNTFKSELAKSMYQESLSKQEAGDIANAIILMNKSLEIEPNNIGALLILGNLYKQSSKFELSKTTYEDLIKLNPNLPIVYLNYSELLIKTNQFQQSIDIAKKGTKLSTASEFLPNFSFNISVAYSKMDSCEQAIHFFTLLRELKNNNLSKEELEHQNYLHDICSGN